MSIEEDVVTRAGPATKRGQYLLSADLLNLLSGPWTPFRQEQFGLTILAIEQEAADLERRRIGERVTTITEETLSAPNLAEFRAILEEGAS